jgi:hypothetical protein
VELAAGQLSQSHKPETGTIAQKITTAAVIQQTSCFFIVF